MTILFCGQEFYIKKKLRVCWKGSSASGTHAAMVSFILIENVKNGHVIEIKLSFGKTYYIFFLLNALTTTVIQGQ
jgi:hypothetical protein